MSWLISARAGVGESDREIYPLKDSFRLAIDTIPGLVWTSLPDGYVDFLNQRWCEYTGLSLEKAVGWGWQAAVCSEDLPGLLAVWRGLLASGEPGEVVARLRRFDGELRWFLFRAVPLCDAQGNLVKWYGQTIDIDEQKRAEALLAGEKRLLEMIAKGDSLQSILDTLSRLVEETAGGCLCSIILEDPGSTRLQHDAAPVLPSTHNGAKHDVTVNLQSKPLGVAPYLKEQLIATDVVSDKRRNWYESRAPAAERGPRACWSAPILSTEGAVLGTFALYSPEPGGPTPQQQNVVKQMTHLAAVAIERQCAMEELQARQELIDLAQKAARVMAFDWYLQQEFNTWSPELEALYGQPPGSFDGRYQSWKKLIYPSDWPLVIEALKHAHKTGEVSAEFRVVWPDGSIHWLTTSGQMFFDEGGNPFRMVGFTGDVTPRKLAEEELRRSEAYLNQGQRLSQTGSFGWNISNGEIYWSEETFRIFEYDRSIKPALEHVVGRTHPEDRGLVQATIERAQLERNDFELEHRLLMPDSSVKWLYVKAHGSEKEGSGPVSFFGSVMDITERKRAESLLRESEQRFRAIFDEAGTGITLVDLASDAPIKSNRALQRMLGCSGDELSRFETFDALTYEENRESDAALFRELLKGKRDTLREEKHFIRRDGNSVWANVLFTLLRDSEGWPRYIIAMHEDITERKQAIEELRRSEAYSAEAQRLSQTGSFFWHVATGELTWSEETYRIYELDPTVKPTFEFVHGRIHPDDFDLFRQTAERASIDGEDFELEHRLQMPDGSIKCLQVVAHAIKDESGQSLEYVGAVRDVTERKTSEDALSKMRAELAHVARVSALGEMTASIAHEVNQPLAGIVINANACLRWLDGESPNLDGARGAAQRIIRDGKRAGEVIKRLRALFGKTGAANTPLDLNEAIQEVLVLTRRELQRNMVAVRTLFDDELPRVIGDRVQLQQVVLNLIMNASEAMSGVEGRPRELVISTRLADGEKAQVSVTDSGVGLDAQEKERIFEAFYTNKNEGMGMGLSISRSIVENHNGRLWAEPNDGPGAGFFFTVPLQTVPAQNVDA
jgi:PAS domain S-box-containing protein